VRDVVCGALGLLGVLVFGSFLVTELGSAYRHGRTNGAGLPRAFTGCVLVLTGPMLAAGLVPFGLGWWSLLTPAGQALLLLAGRQVARLLGSTREVSLRHARSEDLPVRHSGVAKLIAVADLEKDRDARRALEDALGSGDPEILRSAAVALSRAGLMPVVAEALAKPFLDPWRATAESYSVGELLRELGADAAGPLLKLLESPAACRVAILSALRGLKDERVGRAVQRLLGDPDASVRAAAVEWVGREDPPGARELLLPALKDATSLVRTSALRAFEARRDLSAADELLRLTGDESSAVRRVAIEVLGKLKEPRVAGPAIRALQEPDDESRYWAILALGEAGAAEAVEPLLAALEDPAVDLRAHVARSLGRIGDRRACEGLARAMRSDPSYATRVRAAEALEAMGWRAEAPADRSALAIAKRSWDHPFEADPETLEGFQAALKDGDAAVGALPRLARLLQEKAAQISDSWLMRLSEVDNVLGPEHRGSAEALDCQPVRKAARAEIARRAR
jgi:HEAT repeat protein